MGSILDELGIKDPSKANDEATRPPAPEVEEPETEESNEAAEAPETDAVSSESHDVDGAEAAGEPDADAEAPRKKGGWPKGKKKTSKKKAAKKKRSSRKDKIKLEGDDVLATLASELESLSADASDAEAQAVLRARLKAAKSREASLKKFAKAVDAALAAAEKAVADFEKELSDGSET